MHDDLDPADLTRRIPRDHVLAALGRRVIPLGPRLALEVLDLGPCAAVLVLLDGERVHELEVGEA